MDKESVKRFLRFLRDIKYELCVSPLGIDFMEMSPEEAKANFEWFIEKIPERIHYLTQRCAYDLKVSPSVFDLSPNSLIYIWRWFLQTARIEKTPKEELEIMRKQFGHLGESFINKEKLSVSTEFILQDIGMYFGEMFVRNYNSIQWSYRTKPKRYIFVNQPILIGFVDTNYDPPFHDRFAPVHMVGVQAMNMFDKTQNEKDLYNLFMRILRTVPKDM